MQLINSSSSKLLNAVAYKIDVDAHLSMFGNIKSYCWFLMRSTLYVLDTCKHKTGLLSIVPNSELYGDIHNAIVHNAT